MNATTPVVFLHAFPLHAGMWEGQRAALGGRRSVAPNFPGFARQHLTDANLTVFARGVLAELDTAGFREFVVAGLSMGGYVAFRLQALVPDRVVGMVLADTRSGADDAEAKAKRAEQARRVREEGMGWLPDALVPALLGETTRRERPEVVARTQELMKGASPEGVARALEAMRGRPDSTEQLETIACPTLVMVGEEDTLTPPAEARAMVEKLPDARLVELAGAGHLSNLEAPAAFDAALLEFLG